VTQTVKQNITIGGIIGGAVIFSALLAYAGFETKESHAADISVERAARTYQYDRLLCEVQALRRDDHGAVCR
jgi:hypothetical protein